MAETHRDRMKARIAERLASLADLELTVVSDAPGAKVYRIGRPGTVVMSTTIAAIAGRVVITGDHSPGLHGVVSAIGYDEHWLAGAAASWDYLAGKFLGRAYHPECAKEGFLERRASLLEEEGDEDWLDVITEVLSDDCSHEAVEANRDDLQVIFDGELPGWWYDPADVVTLAAIAQRFGQLLARKGVERP